MRLLLAGATGFVGGEVLAQALQRASVASVTVLTRRRIGAADPKLKEVVLPDFDDYSRVTHDLDVDACIWCLGVSQFAVSQDEYIRITCDYALSAARAMFAVAPRMRFCFVSGAGADREEKHRVLNRNIKGRAERELSKLDANVFCFRPAFIRPAYAGQKRPLVTRLYTPIAFVADLFTEGFSVGCRPLASCLLDVAEHGASEQVLDNRAIKNWAPRVVEAAALK